MFPTQAAAHTLPLLHTQWKHQPGTWFYPQRWGCQARLRAGECSPHGHKNTCGLRAHAPPWRLRPQSPHTQPRRVSPRALNRWDSPGAPSIPTGHWHPGDPASGCWVGPAEKPWVLGSVFPHRGFPPIPDPSTSPAGCPGRDWGPGLQGTQGSRQQVHAQAEKP